MLGLKLNHVRQKGHGTKKICKSCFYCTGKKLSFEHVTLATITMSNFLVSYVSWWRHQMETFSALLATCAGSPVNSPHKGQRRGALMFSLICVWINDWVNNREAGDLRRYRAHCDVIIMHSTCPIRPCFWMGLVWDFTLWVEKYRMRII